MNEKLVEIKRAIMNRVAELQDTVDNTLAQIADRLAEVAEEMAGPVPRDPSELKTKIRWTEEEDDELRTVFALPNPDIHGAGQRLGRSFGSVMARASRLGLTRMGRGGKWTPIDDTLLAALYPRPDLTLKQIAASVGHDEGGCRSRASVLKLRRPPRNGAFAGENDEVQPEGPTASQLELSQAQTPADETADAPDVDPRAASPEVCPWCGGGGAPWTIVLDLPPFVPKWKDIKGVECPGCGLAVFAAPAPGSEPPALEAGAVLFADGRHLTTHDLRAKGIHFALNFAAILDLLDFGEKE